MIYKSEIDLAKDIKASHIENLYLFYGNENYLIDLYCDELKKACLNNPDDSFNLNIIDGKTFSYQDLSDTVEAMPLLSEKRVVILENPDIAKITSNTFESIVCDVPPYCCFIVIFKDFEITPTRNKQHKQIISLFDKYGFVCNLNTRTDSDLIKFIINRAKKEETVISYENAQLLNEKCSNNMQKISTELAKLIAFAEKSEITKDMIENVVVPTVEAQIFDLSKAVTNGNINLAMDILDKLFYLRQPPVVILSVLSYYFTDIYKAHIAKEKNIQMDKATTLFGYKTGDFRIKNSYRSSNVYSMKQITEILDILATADLNLKSSRLNDRYIIELAITQIIAVKER